MDEIHVKSDITYKGGKIFAPNLDQRTQPERCSRSERGSLAKLAPQLTVKACFPSSIERQHVRLVLNVFNDLTLSALEIQNEKCCREYRNNTSTFVRILLTLWKIFNVSIPFKEQITNYLTESCGFSYLLSAFQQTDQLEHHCGLYRMMADSSYHISYIQILETERRLKLSNILKMFSDQQDSSKSIHSLVRSTTSPFITSSDDQIVLEPYLDGIALAISRSRRLKYPSEPVLSSVITVWKILFAIEDNDHLANLLVHGPARKYQLSSH
ncbi:hypothetical protein LOD99_15567 [Oopsacas minuta]|uniref:Uncharacterized protein n=1 Tax=Oopsacas minuta TaxID=111878 RepID=A0AAV7KBT3_9METZ|nr:hypothetical protein LOD99_15567 [Oopsacas minuta]